jgi:hypothetical protein
VPPNTIRGCCRSNERDPCEIQSRKSPRLLASSVLLCLFAFTATASAGVDAPDVTWKGTTYPRKAGDWDKTSVQSPVWGLRFDNERGSGALTLYRFEANVAYRCDDGRSGRKVLTYKRNFFRQDDADVWFVDDDGVPAIAFTWKAKNENGWVDVKGRAKMKASDSNEFEPDARGRIAWGNGECRSIGGADTPMGWVATRSDTI